MCMWSSSWNKESSKQKATLGTTSSQYRTFKWTFL